MIPLNDHILIQDYAEDSPLVSPPNTEDQQHGKVVAVADGVDVVSVGDIVFYDKHMTTKLDDNGDKYYAIKDSDLIAKKI